MIDEKAIHNKIKNLPRIGGYVRRMNYGSPIVEVGNEDRQIDPITRSLRKPNSNDQQRIFAYSKVVNSMYLRDKVELQFKPEPWINCIAVGDKAVGYIWDTRQIVGIDDSGKASKLIREAAWNDTVTDVYNCFDNKPMLVDNGFGASDAMKLANKWVQPFIRVPYYQTRKFRDILRHEEFEILTYMPRTGEIYIGEVVVEEVKSNKYRSYIRMEHELLKDVWPSIDKKCEKFTIQKIDGLIDFNRIQFALLEGLIAK